jgi:hypothetical protein
LNHLMLKAVGMVLATISCASYPSVSLSQTPTPTAAVHDGQHDFDFNIACGTPTSSEFLIHLRAVRNPLN